MSEAHPSNGHPAASDRFAELTALLVGPEREAIRRLRQRLDDPSIHAEEVGQVLADAVRLQDKSPHLRQALQPIIEQSIRLSVQRDPTILSDSLFPIVGAAVRKAVVAALASTLETMNSVVEQRFSLRSLAWRWQALTSGRSFAEIVLLKSLLYRVEQVFLIHRTTGLLLAHRAAGDVVVKDTDMVSGMLTAIQSFVQDSFGSAQDDELETMQVGEHSVLVRHSPLVLLAAVIRGRPPAGLKAVLDSVLERFCAQFSQEIASFNGATEPFESAQPLLGECFLGQAAKTVRRISPILWLIPATALIALLMWTAFLYRQDRRWQDYLKRMSGQPGIVIASAERQGGTFVLSGFRDPLAVDPTALLAASHLSPGQVRFHWVHFEFAQEPFSTLRSYAAARQQLETYKFHFDRDSSVIAREQMDAVEGLASDVRRLLDLASRTHRSVIVEIAGHTDASGTEARNATLAESRANQVRNLLITLGIDGRRLVARRGERPNEGHAGTSDESAQFDREVSFRVIESPAK